MNTVTDHATILRMLRWFVFVTLPLIFYTAAPRYTFAEKNPLPIPVQPGDTWTALSIRYQLSVSELMAAAGAMKVTATKATTGRKSAPSVASSGLIQRCPRE